MFFFGVEIVVEAETDVNTIEESVICAADTFSLEPEICIELTAMLIPFVGAIFFNKTASLLFVFLTKY